MSLVVTDGDGEQNEMRMLQDKLEVTMKVVITLTAQLNELKEQVQWRGRDLLLLKAPRFSFIGLFEDVSPAGFPTSGFELSVWEPVVSVQMTEQRKRRQRMGFVDVQAGASAALPPSAAGGNHQLYKT